MVEETDALRRLIAERREDLEVNIRDFQSLVRTTTWTSLFALVAAFGGGLVLSLTTRRGRPGPQ